MDIYGKGMQLTYVSLIHWDGPGRGAVIVDIESEYSRDILEHNEASFELLRRRLGCRRMRHIDRRRWGANVQVIAGHQEALDNRPSGEQQLADALHGWAPSLLTCG